MLSKLGRGAALLGAAAIWIPAMSPAFAEPTSEEVRNLVLADLRLNKGQDLLNARHVCVMGLIVETKAGFEERHGQATFPAVGVYCATAVRTAVEIGELSSLYYDLAAKQLGIAGSFVSEGLREAVGDAPARIIANVRLAADAGADQYEDASGELVPLGCPLALDVGATWAVANPTVARHSDVTPQQLQKLVAVCFNPEIGEVTLSTTGETLTIQQIGLLVGEQIGREAVSGSP